MTFLRYISPFRAYRDLRAFLGQRQPHELWFLMLAIVLTGLLIIGFVKDSSIAPEYHRHIQYFESWPADRSEAEILAQQKIDGPIEAKRKADQKAREEKLRQDFKKIDDKMTAWGL